MSVTDELLENNQAYAESFAKGDLPLPPAKKVAVVACMDARLIPTRVLGLEEGDAHVIRNAGGVITDLQGQPIFPFDLKNYAGKKVPFLAGGPASHPQLLREITGG